MLSSVVVSVSSVGGAGAGGGGRGRSCRNDRRRRPRGSKSSSTSRHNSLWPSLQSVTCRHDAQKAYTLCATSRAVQTVVVFFY